MYGLSCTVEGFFLPVGHFVIFCIGHLENTGLPNYTDFPSVDVFNYIIQHKKKSPFISSEKS